MSGSPFKKNYLNEITGFSCFKGTAKKTDNQPKRHRILQNHKQSNRIEAYSNCQRTVIDCKNSVKINKNDYFELLMFHNGIFNINKVHISSISPADQKNKLTKACIPSKERLERSVFLLPTQTVIQCQYDLENKFHKQMLFYSPGHYLIVNNFTHGLLDKEQYNINLQDLFLVESQYDKGKLIRVKDYHLSKENYQVENHCQTHNVLNIKLQKFIKNKNLCQSIYSLTQGKFDWLQPIQIISGETSYFGETNSQTQLPNGFGLLINRKFQNEIILINKTSSEKSQRGFKLDDTVQQRAQSKGWEVFCGTFNDGLLDFIGSIWFRNGSTYFGQFQYGTAIGLGKFFSLKDNVNDILDDDVLNLTKTLTFEFSFKDNKTDISESDFKYFMRCEYFNVQTAFKRQEVFDFINNQHEKLKKIYPLRKKIFFQREDNMTELQAKIQISRQNDDANSRQIYDQFQDNNIYPSNKTFKKEQSRRKDQQITFSKNRDIQDIFHKIKVNNPQTQTFEDTLRRRKNFDFNAQNFKLRNNTSRSDDHRYRIPGSAFKNEGKLSKNQTWQESRQFKQSPYLKQSFNRMQRNYQRPNMRLINEKSENQEQESASFNKPSLEQKFNRQIDLGFEQVDSNYTGSRNDRKMANLRQQDFIQKQFGVEKPKKLVTPHFFIVQNDKNTSRYDPSVSKMLWKPQNQLHKNTFYKFSPVKTSVNLSPTPKNYQIQNNQKQNYNNFKQYERILNKGKIKRIFTQDNQRY